MQFSFAYPTGRTSDRDIFDEFNSHLFHTEETMNTLITKSLAEGNVIHLLNFPKEFMSPLQVKMVDWVKGYLNRHGQPPTLPRFIEEFDIFVPMHNLNPITDIYDRTLVEERNIYTRNYLMAIQDDLKEGKDPLPYIQKLHKNIASGGNDVSYYTKHDRSLYMRGGTAIPYGIPQLDKYTGGVAKGDLIYLVGRLNTGKTTVSLWFTTKWLMDDKRILMASNENRADDVIGKIDAFIGGWNPLKKRTMEWTEDDKKRINTVSYIASNMKGEVIIPNKPVRGMDELNNLVYVYQPDIVIIDGIHLMKGASGDSHWEKITDISRNLKVLAESEGVPLLGVHQANRNAAGKKVEIEHIAYADALGQDADLIMGINQEDDGDIFVESIKNRWGKKHWGLFMKFFWDTMFAKVYEVKDVEMAAA